LSKTDFDGTGIPAAGDNVVHFGNRDNTARQSAIVINPLDGGAVEIYSGVGSYSLSEKNRIGMGTNPATGEAYLYGHGNLYFGDQDMTDPESTWITFQKKEGSDRKKLYIKGNIEMGADTTGLQNVEEFKNLENKVDNLQIGNLNLLKNTRGFSEGWAGDGLLQQDKYLGLSVYYQTGVDSTDRYQDIRYQNTLLLPDTEYTLSFYAKGSGHLVTYVFPNALGQIIMTNGCPEWVGSKPTDGHCEYPLSSEWKRYFVTFRTTDDTTQLSPSGTSKTVLFRVLKGPNEAYICGAKLEKGNVHSDWSPAPEDADNSGLQFIKQIFPNGLINNIATVSQLLAVRNSMDTNANIVAGIYGGGVKKLEDNGFKHNVYGKLMIFAGAENIDKVGQAKTRIYEDGTIITNKLIAEGGQIGGFNISAIQLSATTYTKDDYDKDVFNSEMVLSANYIRFRDKDCRIIIGSQTTVGTQMIFPVQINVNRITNNTTPLQQNIGISLNVSGAQTYDGAAEHGNHAISINQGHICGFRLKTRRISSSQLISPLDNILLVTASITLTLPAYPEDGQMYIIKNITSAANTTLKVGATGHYLNNGKYNRITQFQWNTGVILMAIWDAVNKIWQLGWTNIG
jgi:hypothetical protein